MSTQEFLPGKTRSYLASKDYIPEYDDLVRKITKLHVNEKFVADFFDISLTKLRKWRKEHHSFNAAYREGCTLADAEVASAVHSRALGYTVTDTTTTKQIVKKLNGETEHRITETTNVRHYPPDTSAGIFWLQMRQKEAWKLSAGEKPGTTVALLEPPASILNQPLPIEAIDATQRYQELMK